MRKYRMLIALVMVLIIVAGAYFTVVNLLPEKPADEEAAPLPTFSLCKFGTTDVDRIDFELQDGYKYAIVAVNTKNEAGGTSRNYLIEGKEQYDFERNTLGMAMLAITDISVNSIADENPKDPLIYGFGKPTAKMTITPYEGDKVTIILGSAAPIGTGYYAMVEGKPEVYVLSSYVTKYITATDKFYRSLSVTAYSDVTKEISAITVTENGEPLIGVRVKSKDEMDRIENYGSATALTAPIEYEGNDTIILETFFPSVQAINAISVVEDGTANAAKYGLTENTTVLKIDNVDGTSRTITLSQSDSAGYRYGIVSGISSIMLFKSSDFDFIYTDYKTMMYKIVWLHNIENVARVEMDLNGEKHALDFAFSPDPEDDTKKLLAAKLDGADILDTNGRRLYIKILSPFFYDFTEDAKAGKIEYSFKIIYFDGREFTMEFAKLNERQYEAIRDGENTGYYVNVNDLTAITKSVARVINGDVLSMSD